ncbi:MAG TPA: phospholipid carrier-dependent glycosyltransferase, partial [Candidatus Limnocylindrales bacterium]|nr:phospholipid carrier-dependent glycosyltransferase [Candidatus Limnocylindrales bacterium]
WATIALSIAAFINLHGVLTTPLYATPNLETLPLGELFRQPIGIITSALLSTGAFVFVAWQLRPAAAVERQAELVEPDEEQVDEDDGASLEGAPVGLALAVADDPVADLMPVESPTAQPSVTDQVRGWFAWLTASTSVRRDRSALLVGESGGRLDRRDLMVVLLVFVAAMLLRTYRLEVPYSMHFDEVYHARTATEFLQEWRYGEPHQIYEFTHPHLAKYVMAVGIAGLGNNRVTDEADLGVPVASAVLEERWSPADALGVRNGDRLLVATGSELRVYDLADGTLETTVSGPFTALAVDPDRHTLLLGGADGTIWQLDTPVLDEMRTYGEDCCATAQQLTTIGDLVGDLSELALAEGQLIAVSSDGTVVSLDAATGSETGRTELDTAHSPVGTPSRTQVIVDPALVDDPAAVADTLAGLLDDDADRIEAVIVAATEPVAIAGQVGDDDDAIQTEIDAGNLPGVSMESAPGVALATDSGISLLDAATLAELGTFATDEPVGGMTFVAEGADDPSIYAASGQELVRLRLPTDADVSLGGSIWMPNTVTDVVWNPTTTMVHALGLSQDGAASTVYVIEPRSNSVFADARLDFAPTQLVLDVQPERPAEDRVDMLAFDASGRMATIDVGGNGYAYRLPGVIAGALTAALIYLLVRFLFMRRTVALIAALLVLVDGMFFANARIAMNDTYVALFIVAAFTLFVPLWLGRWHSRWAIVTGLLGVGLLLGLALASKWVGAYAIGAVGLLILLRSALGRLIALAAMILMTGLLGYIAISPSTTAATPQLNYLFLILMISLTVLLTVGITRRPVRFTRDELRLVVIGPIVGGVAALAFGVYRSMSPPTEGSTLTPERLLLLGAVAIGFGLAIGAGAWYAGRRGLGPLARVPRVELIAEPASPPPPRGWLRPGSGALGLPWLLGLAAITLIPLAIYGASYLPWIELGNRWTDTFPSGNFGQTFLDLQKSMYEYHNNLRAAHAASSPWWAWPLDLKPVWFEQNSYAGNTTAVIYDTGNLVIFWLAIPAVAWVALQAWRRRSLSLAFICVAIACLWLPWARIDRATFQYHIFTTLPFSFMALAYFLAELWHGPSKGTWLLARVAAAVAIIGAPLLWLLRQPLCGIANTERANPGTEVCASLSRDLMLTDIQGIGLVLALGGLIAAGVFVFSYLRESPDAGEPGEARLRSTSRSLVLPVSFSVVLLGVVVLIIGAGLPGQTLFTTRIHAEWPALAALLLLTVPAFFVLRATDPRRYVVGALSAAVLWFVAFYTNIASLPVPTPLSQIHLGLLPTWNWGFQFGVNLDPAGGVPLQSGGVILLTVAVSGLCVAAAYAARNWNSLRAQPASEISEVPEGG